MYIEKGPCDDVPNSLTVSCYRRDS